MLALGLGACKDDDSAGSADQDVTSTDGTGSPGADTGAPSADVNPPPGDTTIAMDTADEGPAPPPAEWPETLPPHMKQNSVGAAGGGVATGSKFTLTFSLGGGVTPMQGDAIKYNPVQPPDGGN